MKEAKEEEKGSKRGGGGAREGEERCGHNNQKLTFASFKIPHWGSYLNYSKLWKNLGTYLTVSNRILQKMVF